MLKTKLTKRVFNSPLIRFANFKDGSHINLIRLNKPYSNGYSYAIHSTNSDCGLCKTLEDGIKTFNLLIENHTKKSLLTSSGVTGNCEKL